MKKDEFNPLREEFTPAADEFAPLAPEFTEKAPLYKGRDKKSKRFYAAAAILLTLLLLFTSVTKPPSGDPSAPKGTPGAESTAAPTAPADSPAPRITPTPGADAQTPSCEPVFIAFSDELNAKLRFTQPEAILSVHAELWDSLGSTIEQSWDVPHEKILLGTYELPDMMGVYDMYMAHHDSYDPNDPFPVPMLRLSTVYVDGGQEKTAVREQPVFEELGWSIRDKDDHILFRTYESKLPVRLSVGTDASESRLRALNDGEFFVVADFDGVRIQEGECRIEQDEETWKDAAGNDILYYFLNLTIPKRDGSHSVTVTVYQKLTGYDDVWSRTTVIEY